MILITVGTQPQQFNRLFDEIKRLVEIGRIKEKIVAQTGPNKFNLDGVKVLEYMDFESMKGYMSKSDLIISHGGTGSIITALKMGKTVIGVPRQSQYGEHINNHQLDLIKILSDKELIIPVWDISDLESAIVLSRTFTPKPFISGTNIIIDDLVKYISELN